LSCPWHLRQVQDLRNRYFCMFCLDYRHTLAEWRHFVLQQQDRQCRYNVTLGRVHLIILPWKAINIKQYKCVSVSLPSLFSLQIAFCLLSIVFSSVVCLALSHFSTLSHKRKDYRKKIIAYKMCDLMVFKISVWNISCFKIIQRYIVINFYMCLCKVFIILFRFKLNSNFLDRFSRYSQILNFMKIRLLRSGLLCAERQAERQTDRQRDGQRDMKSR
jgi:hypothetical protein